jgi:hypothetical protein
MSMQMQALLAVCATGGGLIAWGLWLWHVRQLARIRAECELRATHKS